MRDLNLHIELDSLRETEMSERSASSNRLEELIKEMKDSFAEKVTLDLKQVILESFVVLLLTDYYR